MIDVNYFSICRECFNIIKIKKLFIEEESEETYLVKEYSCGCGYTFLHKEVINFTV